MKKQCFFGCSALETVKLPEGLKSIEERAFAECTSLREIDLPDGLESTGYGVFQGCTSLVSVRLPHSLTNIGIDCFANTAITKLVIPGNDAISIAFFHFRFMSRLREIVFLEGLTKIEPEGAIRVYEGGSYKIIRHAIFDEMKSLEAVTFPASLQNFPDIIFEKCENLRTVRIRSGFQKANPTLFPTGITVEYEGSAEAWAEICNDPQGLLEKKNITVKYHSAID